MEWSKVAHFMARVLKEEEEEGAQVLLSPARVHHQ
jgi:hypothetical protein